MKNHKKKQVRIYDIEGTIPEVFERITVAAEEMKDPHIITNSYGYDGGDEWYVEGWVPMTEAEITKAKRAAAQLRERKKAALKSQIERELETVRSLAKKHGLVIKG